MELILAGGGHGAVVNVRDKATQMLAALPKEKLQEMQAELMGMLMTVTPDDEANKDKVAQSDEVKLLVVGLGGGKAESKVTTIMLLPFLEGVTQGGKLEEDGTLLIESRVGLPKELKEGPQKPEIDYPNEPLHDADAVRDSPDPDLRINRVGLRLKPFEHRRVLKPDGSSGLGAMHIGLVSLQLSAWHEAGATTAAAEAAAADGAQDEKAASRKWKINVLLKLLSVSKEQAMPAQTFVDLVRKNRAYSQQIVTRVPEYCREKALMLAANGNNEGAIPKKELNGIAYRNDNPITIVLGYGHGLHLMEDTLVATGLTLVDVTSPAASNFQSGEPGKNIKKNAYRAELRGTQWRDSPTDMRPKEVEAQVKFLVQLTLWPDDTVRFGITSNQAWINLAPMNMPYLRAVVYGRENAERSFKNQLTSTRFQQLDHKDDLNRSTGTENQAFVITVAPDAIICDPVDGLYRVVGIPVTKRGVMAIWGKASKPPKLMDGANPGSYNSMQLVNCLSEHSRDFSEELADPNLEFRVLTNATSSDPTFDRSEFGAIATPEEGDRLVQYFAECLAKQLPVTRQQWATKNLEGGLRPGEQLARCDYSFPGDQKILYVFAINKTAMQRRKDDFAKYFEQFAAASKPPAVPPSAAIEDGKAGGATVEEVKDGGEGTDAPAAEAPTRPNKRKAGKHAAKDPRSPKKVASHSVCPLPPTSHPPHP